MREESPAKRKNALGQKVLITAAVIAVLALGLYLNRPDPDRPQTDGQDPAGQVEQVQAKAGEAQPTPLNAAGSDKAEAPSETSPFDEGTAAFYGGKLDEAAYGVLDGPQVPAEPKVPFLGEALEVDVGGVDELCDFRERARGGHAIRDDHVHQARLMR